MQWFAVGDVGSKYGHLGDCASSASRFGTNQYTNAAAGEGGGGGTNVLIRWLDGLARSAVKSAERKNLRSDRHCNSDQTRCCTGPEFISELLPRAPTT